jgi:hypothetical protein
MMFSAADGLVTTPKTQRPMTENTGLSVNHRQKYGWWSAAEPTTDRHAVVAIPK